jgi:hypothetical protein
MKRGSGVWEKAIGALVNKTFMVVISFLHATLAFMITQSAIRAIGSFARKVFAVYIRFLFSYFRA